VEARPGHLLHLYGLIFRTQSIKLDDAFIYARYIKNALDGDGLVFNAGERVNALTSPLMGYLLLILSWLLHGRVLLAEMILSTIFLASACSFAEAMVPYSGMILASTAFFYTCFGTAQLIAHHDGTSWLEQDKPDYVIIHDKPVFDEAAAAISPNYVRLPIPFGGIYIARRLSSR
jgi:hypothetical protein